MKWPLYNTVNKKLFLGCLSYAIRLKEVNAICFLQHTNDDVVHIHCVNIYIDRSATHDTVRVDQVNRDRSVSKVTSYMGTRLR